MTDITYLLNQVHDEDPDGLHQLLLLVYQDLQRVARRKMSAESRGHTLTATALVHEAYLRLVREQRERWEDRGHFFSAAAEAMRRILIESARRKKRLRHGGAIHRVDQAPGELPAKDQFEDLLLLNDALDRLACQKPQAANLVKLRFFAGLTIDQAAESLDISPRTAKRLWTYARAWLYDVMYGEE
ncbi:MAG: sigma-70 family RNA polymerase sigma factor [Planctomycetales bacterium]|nr:sigma-70 family RNA polymerase sigma factor [Planctomycetales bacterium]